MKLAIALISLVALAPLAHAQANDAAELSALSIDQDTINVSYALIDVAQDAIDLGKQYAAAAGIAGTTAGAEINDLLKDTEALKHSAVRLSQWLDNNGSDDDIADEIAVLDAKYSAVSRGSAKVFLQLNSQGKATEAYRLRSAYSDIRGRYVYIKAHIAL